ncbi:hypothetical protein Pla144_41430 [Bythopirellula polymerisocia]|uniref:Uncharacterized protein n=1 Tax=Bythopirellula polymerisocia TaxID=2528003 RepID=A0A5C6CCX9_9BACT|nr:hypothetical protein Pla144_41430 [Bythopirellula polymerisocia]
MLSLTGDLADGRDWCTSLAPEGLHLKAHPDLLAWSCFLGGVIRIIGLYFSGSMFFGYPRRGGILPSLGATLEVSAAPLVTQKHKEKTDGIEYDQEFEVRSDPK